MNKQQFTHGPVADPSVVRALTSHLLEAYEDFIANFDGTVDYVDGFMASHNFHVFIIESLVKETDSDIWRTAAADTFERRMKAPGQQDTKGPNHPS